MCIGYKVKKNLKAMWSRKVTDQMVQQATLFEPAYDFGIYRIGEH